MAEEIDKYEEDVDRLIDTGKEKGYLTFGEVNDLLPNDITSAEDMDDLLTTLNTQGIDVLSGDGRRGRGVHSPRDGRRLGEVQPAAPPREHDRGGHVESAVECIQ